MVVTRILVKSITLYIHLNTLYFVRSSYCVPYCYKRLQKNCWENVAVVSKYYRSLQPRWVVQNSFQHFWRLVFWKFWKIKLALNPAYQNLIIKNSPCHFWIVSPQGHMEGCFSHVVIAVVTCCVSKMMFSPIMGGFL